MERWSYSNRQEADSLNKVQIYFLKKHGYLSWWNRGNITWTSGWSGNKSSITIESSIHPDKLYVRFIYTQTDRDTGEKKDFDYKVSLTTTNCHFGGERYWFICPLTANGKYCGKRVGILYKAGDYFGCRYCYNLTYESRNENRRYKDYPLFAVLGRGIKAEKLEEQIKRRYYAGKPTRKQRVLERMYARTLPYLPFVKEMVENNKKEGI